jgi:hypothetical protein
LVDLYENQQEGHGIEGDLNAIIFNAVAATNPEWKVAAV